MVAYAFTTCGDGDAQHGRQAMGLHILTRRALHYRQSSTADGLVFIEEHDTFWIITKSHKEALMGRGAPDWFEPESCPAAERVESGHHRAVWRWTRDGLDLFAKLSRVKDARDRFKTILLGSPAEREWRISAAAAVLGVPVPTFVGLAVRLRGSPATVFLTRAVENATPLTTAWRNRMDAEAGISRRQSSDRLIDAAADLLSRSHRVGFVHRDGHPNNILVSRQAGGNAPCACYVDTHGSHLYRREVPVRAIARSLAQLDQHFHRMATRSDRLRFLQRYFAQSHTFDKASDDREIRRMWLTEIDVERTRLAADLARVRDRRLRRNGKYFATLRLDRGWRATVCLAMERRHLFPEPGVPDRTEGDWIELLTPWIESTERTPDAEFVAQRAGIESTPQTISGLLNRLCCTLGASKHRRAFETCHRRRHRDQAADLALGVLEHRSAGLVDRTLLLRPLAPGKQSARGSPRVESAKAEEKNKVMP